MKNICKKMNQKANAYVNLSSPNPRQRENIKLIFYFQTPCGASKNFMKALKAFIKPFEELKRG